MCIEVVIERGVLETEGVGGYFVCLSTHRPDAGKKVLRQLGSIRLMSLAAVGGGVFLAHKMMTTPVLEPETASSVVPETRAGESPYARTEELPDKRGSTGGERDDVRSG